MKLFVPTFKTSYSHPLRRAWRKVGTDPVVTNALRIACLIAAALGVFVLLWVGNYVKDGTSITPGQLMLIVVSSFTLDALAVITWAASAGYPRFALEFPLLLEDLGIHENFLSAYSEEDIHGLAITSLSRLGYLIKRAEKEYSDPWSNERRSAKRAFELSYQRYLKFGIIRDVGYGHFFKKTDEVASV